MVFYLLPVVRALSKLANGKYPGRHVSDYLSSEDMEKTGRAGCPQLGSNPFDHHIKLRVTISLNSISFQTFPKMSAKSKWFQVVVKGLGLQHPSLSSAHVVQAHSALDFSQLRDVFLYSFPYDDVGSIAPLSSTLSPLSLSLTLYTSCDSLRQILHSVSYLSALHLDIGSLVTDAVLNILCETSCQITALTLNRLQIYHPAKHHNEKLGSCLLHLHGTLEYLRLVCWPLTDAPLESLRLCSHLRVISIIEFHSTRTIRPVHTISEIFQMLAYISCLEFFEWSEDINIRTEDILCLYQLLKGSLPCLRHWHMKLSYILLSTMDLQNDEYSVVQSLLVPLLCDKTGDESCTTYRFSMSSEVFSSWICSLRADVCFRLFQFSQELSYD